MINLFIFILSFLISFAVTMQLNYEIIYIDLYVNALIAAIPLSLFLWTILMAIKAKVIDKEVHDIEKDNWNNPMNQMKFKKTKKPTLRRVK